MSRLSRALLGPQTAPHHHQQDRPRSSNAPEPHRDFRGGGLRAGIFGISDGLVSNVSLVLGTAGAHPGGTVIRLAGLAGLFGGSFSMAAGEYISMQAQREAFQRELDVERDALRDSPEIERHELEGIYIERGIEPAVASSVAETLMATPDLALETHAREELGIDPHQLGIPVQAALASFATFAFGAFLPLIPFLGASAGGVTTLIAVAIAACGALVVGGVLAVFTERPVLYSALRSLVICGIAGGITYGIGSAIGVAAH